MSIADWTQISADSKLNEILAVFPTVGPILIQAGRGWVNKRGDLYAQFPDLTVAQYAENNGLETPAVVKSIQGAAEAEEMAKKRGVDDKDESVWRRPPLTIGYTSSYDEREGTSEGNVSVVHVQSSRGPV